LRQTRKTNKVKGMDVGRDGTRRESWQGEMKTLRTNLAGAMGDMAREDGSKEYATWRWIG
jgi:hypothetical protein